MNKILKFAKVFILVDLCLIIFGMIFYTPTWVLNTQVAFIGSLFVTLASFLSYKKNVQNRLSNFETSTANLKVEDRDKIDEIDDPFDLYSEDEELTPSKIKEIIKEEKSKIKRNSFKNTLFSATGFISIYRVVGYLALIIGFFALNNSKTLLPFPFLIGLAIVPISVLISKFTLKLEEDR
ncbi:hypothetical protein [Halarcobacter ebronensis]|nr:hypothetical protein [Halarcobacter ebronensis]